MKGPSSFSCQWEHCESQAAGLPAKRGALSWQVSWSWRQGWKLRSRRCRSRKDQWDWENEEDSSWPVNKKSRHFLCCSDLLTWGKLSAVRSHCVSSMLASIWRPWEGQGHRGSEVFAGQLGAPGDSLSLWELAWVYLPLCGFLSYFLLALPVCGKDVVSHVPGVNAHEVTENLP